LPSTPKQPVLRSGRDSDGPALIALIWSCWSAYPGIRMDVDREMPQLHTLATYYAANGGALWVAEADEAVVGMIATQPQEDTAWEICQVYVDPALHGSGLGRVLLDAAERHAIEAGAERLVLWSDTRFARAHHFYEKRSYVRHGAVRVLNDISNSLEFGYAKPVNGIELLDIAAATSAAERLAEILIACVDQDASVSFLPPLAHDKAKAFWKQNASEVGANKRIVVAAWRNAVLVGTGTLTLAMPENQRHRCEVQKILVDPSIQRSGLGRQILRTLESEAAARGRSLLTLDTRAGDAGEMLYRTEGWQEAGRIPGFTRDARGRPHATVFFWKGVAG
jgi:GNAT superfamily N-acetyltransferase